MPAELAPYLHVYDLCTGFMSLSCGKPPNLDTCGLRSLSRYRVPEGPALVKQAFQELTWPSREHSD
jgi:hypothetical protein